MRSEPIILAKAQAKAKETYPVDTEVIGTVVSHQSYGIFLDINAGSSTLGLIHMGDPSFAIHNRHIETWLPLDSIVKCRVLDGYYAFNAADRIQVEISLRFESIVRKGS